MTTLWERIKRPLSRFIPNHVHDPFGLIARMLASRKPAAAFTLLLTALGVVLTPVDMLMQFAERAGGRRDRSGAAGPFLIICGPARSGTTLVYQVLAENLDVSYVRNLTVMFSRSPVLASRWFARHRQARSSDGYENYYGKTSGMQAPSEANHLWNQWTAADASGFRTRLTDSGAARMVDFLNRFSRSEGRPVLLKNNNVNAFADAIDARLDGCHFICLRRDPVYLAQSLLRARREINGDIEQSYGVVDAGAVDSPADPVEQVVDQVRFLDRLAQQQEQRIGSDRFWIVDYEQFCRDPAALVRRVRSDVLGKPMAPGEQIALEPFTINNRDTDADLLLRIRQALGKQASASPEPVSDISERED